MCVTCGMKLKLQEKSWKPSVPCVHVDEAASSTNKKSVCCHELDVTTVSMSNLTYTPLAVY